MARRTPSWIERQVEAVVGDYFPQQLTILDRDTCLSLVQVTVDYAAELGFEAVDARDVLALGDDGTVTVTAPELRLTPRSLYRLPAVAFRTLIRMRHDPMQWVNGELRSVLAEISSLPKELDGRTEPQLMDRVNIGISLRDKVFTSRRHHFLSSFTIKFVSGSIRAADRGSSGRATAGDSPTRRFREDLVRLSRSWRQAVSDPSKQADLDAALAEFLAEHGGKGQTFVPLVSDKVWDVDPEALIATLPAIAAVDASGDSHPAGSGEPTRRRRLDRRLRRIATERDWVAYGYEQATRVVRDALLRLGERFATRGILNAREDIFLQSLDSIDAIVRGEAAEFERRSNRTATVSTAPARVPGATIDRAEIAGFGASPGVAEGPCRVVKSVDQFGDLIPGEILVCEMTSPAWMPLLAIAGAVVTDRGGMLSHAAIVAREFGKPAVTGTCDATVRMVSGNKYRIDGTVGKVVWL